MTPKASSLLDNDHSPDGGTKSNSTIVVGGLDAAALAKANVNADRLRSEMNRYAPPNQDGRSSSSSSTQPFHAVLEQEIQRVKRLVDYHQHDLEFAAKALLTSAEVTLEQVKANKAGHPQIHSLSQKMDDLVESCYTLQAFLTKNRAALWEVAKQADQQLQTRCQMLVEASLKSNLHSVLVVVASDIYTSLRAAEAKLNRSVADTDQDGLWKAPSSFQRSTTKYWVKEENLTKLLLTCAGEAPLLVYGKKGTLTTKSSRLTRVSEGDKLWTSMVTPITSVYFDAPDMSMYKKRLARLEGAELLRARWYGPKMPQGDGIIFLELKTHHEKWVANQSVKERAAVQERDMRAFLQPVPWTADHARAMILRASPTLTGHELDQAANLLYRMHRLVVKYNLRACVRSVYMRAAFQSAKSNDLRLTLDRTVTLVDETIRADAPLGKQWCLSDEQAKTAKRTVIVPYNVFEVKLVGDNPMPQGLATLISSGVIEEAPKFSKFLTGAAAFQRVSTLPYWANHPSFATMFGLAHAQSSDDAQQYTSLIDPCDCYYLFGGDPTVGNASGVTKPRNNLWEKVFNPTAGGSVDKSDVKIAEKKPVRVEPKSFFANERTFIQWISAALLLLTVSTIMMGNGNYLHTAAMIAFSAFLLIFYATFVYFRRINLLTSGKGYGYIDHVGPTILAAGVGMGVFIVFWDIIEANDILGEAQNYEDGRRLSSFYPRRLFASEETTIASMYEDPSHCYRLPVSGINALTYEPNDAIVDADKNGILVASTAEILWHPFEGGDTSHLVHLHDTELGGLTVVEDRIFALSGGPQNTALLEFEWTSWGHLEEQGRWIVTESATEINGLTYVSNTGDDNSQGQLLLGFNGSVYSYQIPNREHATLNRLERINMKMINHGLGKRDTIASMHHFDGVTYLLHSARGVLHAWDMGTGQFLAEIPLPRLDGDFAGEWKGITLERRPLQEKETSLRGSQQETELLVHLTADAPPQIWTFAVEENNESSRGRFTFPACAAANAMM